MTRDLEETEYLAVLKNLKQSQKVKESKSEGVSIFN